jgi:hypothetical protein
MNRRRIISCCFALSLLAMALTLGVVAHAQTPAAAAPAATAPAPPPTPADAELKDAAGKAPSPMDMQKGDPGGTITGTISDVPAADSVANQVGQNKIAVNFVWTLITGFLVMFMQAGFAMVESGLCRVKNANHTYMMNFFVYTCGSVRVLDYRLRHPDGRRRGQRQSGWIATAEHGASDPSSAPTGASSANAGCSWLGAPTTWA